MNLKTAPCLTKQKTSTERKTLFVAEDSNITMWTFHHVQGGRYKLSATVNGEEKYLKIGETLTLTDSADASVILVTPDNGRISLSSGGKCVSYTQDGFTAAYEENGQLQKWLHLVELSGVSNDDYITYSAEKVSVSNVSDGSSIIVYTRVWNESLKSYEFYAIDHDGALYPCYERGDNLASYTPSGSTDTYESVYPLNPGKSAEIHFPANTIEYKVIECGVNLEVYDSVKINGEEKRTQPAGSAGRTAYDSGWISVMNRPSVVFENHVDPEALRTLNIQKRLYDESNRLLTHEQDPTTFSYRLYLSNG